MIQFDKKIGIFKEQYINKENVSDVAAQMQTTNLSWTPN